eukprot:TRINITY_DN108487_c0_g1_i1.p1 TRINITY_DN108487_c0_g1~~TRINITY_DN108487_c0_g1_i1.p1  ORF type:complete len:193 (-),score=27.72 TRINITY_DN108487_c0_g1_i1:121-699(-)
MFPGVFVLLFFVQVAAEERGTCDEAAFLQAGHVSGHVNGQNDSQKQAHKSAKASWNFIDDCQVICDLPCVSGICTNALVIASSRSQCDSFAEKSGCTVLDNDDLQPYIDDANSQLSDITGQPLTACAASCPSHQGACSKEISNVKEFASDVIKITNNKGSVSALNAWILIALLNKADWNEILPPSCNPWAAA